MKIVCNTTPSKKTKRIFYQAFFVNVQITLRYKVTFEVLLPTNNKGGYFLTRIFIKNHHKQLSTLLNTVIFIINSPTSC